MFCALCCAQMAFMTAAAALAHIHECDDSCSFQRVCWVNFIETRDRSCSVHLDDQHCDWLAYNADVAADFGASADQQWAVGPTVLQQSAPLCPAACQCAAAAPQLGRQCQHVRPFVTLGQNHRPTCNPLAAPHLQVCCHLCACAQELSA